MSLIRFWERGKLPTEARELLRVEKPQLSVERVRGSVTLINFRRPGKACSWNRRWFRGSLIATENRLAAWSYGKRLINVSFDDERWQKIDVSMEGSGTILIAHDASLFHSGWTGRIEIRFLAGRDTRLRQWAGADTTSATT